MRIWMDTEFNGFKGDLISMALVSEDGQEWYRARDCRNPCAWVAQHVMPIIGIAPVNQRELTTSLQIWLRQFPNVHIIADWPEDIAHLCQSMIIGPGVRINTPPLTMEIRRDLDCVASALPHNALEDARAMMASQLMLEAEGEPTHE